VEDRGLLGDSNVIKVPITSETLNTVAPSNDGAEAADTSTIENVCNTEMSDSECFKPFQLDLSVSC